MTLTAAEAAVAAIAGLSYVVYIALCIVTQRSLRRMYGFRTSVQLNILGSPEEVSICLVSVGLIPIAGILRRVAGLAVPCWGGIVYVHLLMSIVLAILCKRHIKRVVKVVSTQLARLRFRSELDIEDPEDDNGECQNVREGQTLTRRFMEKIPNILTGRSIFWISVAWFLGTFSLVLLEPRIQRLLATGVNVKDCDSQCESESPKTMIGILGYLGWAVPASLTIRIFKLPDPFNTSNILLVQACFVAVVAVLNGSFSKKLQSSLPVKHYGLLLYFITWMVMMFLWLTESLLPYVQISRRLRGSKKVSDGVGRNALLKTLTNPYLLQLFQEHLVEDWAFEVLEFYKAATLFRIETRKRIKKCVKKGDFRRVHMEETYELASIIFRRFISSEAECQVNMSGDIVKPLSKFFAIPDINALANSRLSRISTARFEQSCITRIQQRDLSCTRESIDTLHTIFRLRASLGGPSSQPSPQPSPQPSSQPTPPHPCQTSEKAAATKTSSRNSLSGSKASTSRSSIKMIKQKSSRSGRFKRNISGQISTINTNIPNPINTSFTGPSTPSRNSRSSMSKGSRSAVKERESIRCPPRSDRKSIEDTNSFPPDFRLPPCHNPIAPPDPNSDEKFPRSFQDEKILRSFQDEKLPRIFQEGRPSGGESEGGEPKGYGFRESVESRGFALESPRRQRSSFGIHRSQIVLELETVKHSVSNKNATPEYSSLFRKIDGQSPLSSPLASQKSNKSPWLTGCATTALNISKSKARKLSLKDNSRFVKVTYTTLSLLSCFCSYPSL
ncbi:hypothetical protein AAMO2058_000243600 [Amorphochlora amoebiformis]